MRITTIFFFVFLLVFTTSCFEKNSDNAKEAYELWAGEKPEDIEVFHGKYWQSAHFTREYITYLHFQASQEWTVEFIRQNNLVPMKLTEIVLPDNAPQWFAPREGFSAYHRSGFDQGSLFFVKETSGEVYLHDIQL